MKYALRLWVRGQQKFQADSEELDGILELFRDLIWQPRREQFYVTVNAEPGPYPQRSYTIASYQHPAQESRPS
jgi:hypothetical protein